MAHSREIRPRASETKFVVSAALGTEIRAWARANMEPDPHGHGSSGDEYRTTSVYFDTDRLDVFHRRGSYGRSKYRIRRYGTDGVVFLERKMREPKILAKRRTSTDIDALSRLTCGVLESGWDGHWFHRRLIARRLQASCQVSYLRVARLGVHEDDQIRLTLDDDLCAQSAAGLGFEDSAAVPVLDGRMILELKYRGPAPTIFRRLVEDFALTPQPASKYRMGLAAIAMPLSIGSVPASATGTEPFYA